MSRVWASLAVRLTMTRRLEARGDRRIALVSWAFPPSGASSGHLPSTIARVGAQKHWYVSVLCAPAPASPTEQGEAMLELLPRTVTVVRAAGGVDDRNNSCSQVFYSLFPNVDGGFHTALLLADAGRRALAAAPPTVVLAAGPRF